MTDVNEPLQDMSPFGTQPSPSLVLRFPRKDLGQRCDGWLPNKGRFVLNRLAPTRGPAVVGPFDMLLDDDDDDDSMSKRLGSFRKSSIGKETKSQTIT